jgi:hypothetical protein
MNPSWTAWLLLTTANGIAAGATLDQAVKQLPAAADRGVRVPRLRPRLT